MEQEGDNIVCNACSFVIRTVEDRVTHYKTEWHRYNVKRHCAELPPISFDLFNQKLNDIRQNVRGGAAAAASASGASVVSAKPAGFSCKSCKKTFKKEVLLTQHMEGGKHKARMAELEAAGSSASAEVEAVAVAAAAAGGAELKEAEKEMEDGEAGAGDAEEEGKEIPLLQCMFCTRPPFATVPKSLDHMLKKHGFFIPFVEYLEDLEGLLEYLGSKIGVGHTCLYCTKGRRIFKSTEAVQKHMDAKCHCKLALEDHQGNEDEDLLSFYKFPHQDKRASKDDDGEGEDAEMGGAGAGAAAAGEGAEDEDDEDVDVEKQSAKRKVTSINNSNELVLSDGSIIGHRSLQHIYKQNLRPIFKVSKLQQELMSQYFALKMPGYQSKSAHSEKTLVIAKNWQKWHMKVGVSMNIVNKKYFRGQCPM